MTDLFEKVTVKQKNKRTQKEKHAKNAKKEVHDLFVQGTNDSSIVSKRSVEILYSFPVDGCSTHYFNHFVKKAPRRTPVINRGYWIRMRSIRMAVEKITNGQADGQRINIVNLGCGYDPLPFQLLDDAKINGKNLYCIDIDYPELAGYKSQMIKMAPELLSITGTPKETPSSKNITFETDNYALLGCDLTDLDMFNLQMDALKANEENTTNIFIAEVSLAYMTPETANPIIEASSRFFNSHFLILEQLMPAGEFHPFAKRMLNHFKKMEAPLQCVEKYPTIDTQIARFQSLGYASARARDLIGCWELVPDNMKIKVADVEPFDEWEEFFYFGQHYINLHATNQVGVQVYDAEPPHPYPTLETTSKICSEVDLDLTIERKFATSAQINDIALLTCGVNQCRLSSTIQLGGAGEEIHKVITPETFKPRIASTSVTVLDTPYLIGGRRTPGVGIAEFWCLKKVENAFIWSKLPNLSSGRVKHTSLGLADAILVFGGTHSHHGFEYFSTKTMKWTPLSSNLGFSLESANMICLDGQIYLYGGRKHGNDISQFEFNNTLFKLDVDTLLNNVTCTAVFSHESLARYGSQAANLENGKFLIFGGVGSHCYGKDDTVIEVNPLAQTVVGVSLSSTTWQKSNPLIGFSSFKFGENLYLVGGGAVCYGFGSVWGSLQKLCLQHHASNEKVVIL